ncbi:hypothetical protein CDW55_01700 [Chryseobacterium sp. VAUSW3]|nr:hypothetical protein CDW55_01700 [Chryseobacterium sp. VAUSW3]
MQKNEKMTPLLYLFYLNRRNFVFKTGSFCLIVFIFLMESAMRPWRIAKKVYIPLKDLNLRGKTLVFSNEIIATLRTKNLCLILSIDLLESANHRFVNASFQLFLNAKIS